MIRLVSFDMDGTLIAPEFTDWVWGDGIPKLYAEKQGLSLEEAKVQVEQEYRKVGDGAIEWYDIKYWLRFFRLDPDWRALMEKYAGKISVFPDSRPILQRLKSRYPLVLVSNAGREFIEVELSATGLEIYFDRIFSATSDFGEVKKTPEVYRRICDILEISPHEMVHVGDHYEYDYLVPKSLGICSFYLNRTAEGSEDSVIRDLNELGRRLGVL